MQTMLQNSGQGWEYFLSALVLVMVRISGLMVFCPVFSSESIPPRVKVIFALCVSILLAPVVAGLPRGHATIGLACIAGELAAGLMFGISLAMLNEVLLFTGQVLGVQFSFSLVNLLDPNSQVQTPLLGQMFSLMSCLVLLAAGLHRTLLAAFMRSFVVAPPGTIFLDRHVGIAVVSLMAGVFVAALQLAAPVMAATMLVELSVALVGRLSPQLPVMAITVPAKTLVGYVVLIASLALWPRFIETHFVRLLDIGEALVRRASTTG